MGADGVDDVLGEAVHQAGGDGGVGAEDEAVVDAAAFVLGSAESAHIQESLIDGVGEGEAAVGITAGGDFDAALIHQAAGAFIQGGRDGASLAGHHISPGLFERLGDETGLDGHRYSNLSSTL